MKQGSDNRFESKSAALRSAGHWSRHEGFRAKPFMGLGLQRTPHLEDSGLRPSVITRQEGKVKGDDLGMAEEKCFPTMQKKMGSASFLAARSMQSQVSGKA